MSDADIRAEAVARKIVAYLRAHPHAADTLRGIREWWLGDLQQEADAELVEFVLSIMARSGAVVAEIRADGHRIFHAGPALAQFALSDCG